MSRRPVRRTGRQSHAAGVSEADGFALLEAGRAATAEVAFRAAIAREPAVARHRIGLGHALLALANYGEAEETLAVAVRLLGGAEVEAVVSCRAWIAYRTDRFGLAKSLFIQLISTDPGDPVYRLGYGLCAIQEGMALEAALDGLEAFDAALELAPDLALAHLGRAMALHTLRRFGGSVDAARAALAHDGKLAVARVVLAESLLELGEIDGVERELARLDDRAPETPDQESARMAVTARLALARGNLGMAEAHARRAVALAPHSEAAWRVLGQTLAGAGDLQAALAALDRAVVIDRHDPESTWARARLRERIGQPALALEDYRSALVSLTDVDCDPVLACELRRRIAALDAEP